MRRVTARVTWESRRRTTQNSRNEKKIVLCGFCGFCVDRPSCYGVLNGGTRFFVACSNANAISISAGSLQSSPVNPTPYG